MAADMGRMMMFEKQAEARVVMHHRCDPPCTLTDPRYAGSDATPNGAADFTAYFREDLGGGRGVACEATLPRATWRDLGGPASITVVAGDILNTKEN